MKYERLTLVLPNGEVRLAETKFNSDKAKQKAIERLAEYEDKIEAGTLIDAKHEQDTLKEFVEWEFKRMIAEAEEYRNDHKGVKAWLDMADTIENEAWLFRNDLENFIKERYNLSNIAKRQIQESHDIEKMDKIRELFPERLTGHIEKYFGDERFERTALIGVYVRLKDIEDIIYGEENNDASD